MDLDLTPLAAKLASAVAAACVIGGGTMVLHSATEVAVLKSQQSSTDHRLERMENKIDRILEHELRAHGEEDGTRK